MTAYSLLRLIVEGSIGCGVVTVVVVVVGPKILVVEGVVVKVPEVAEVSKEPCWAAGTSLRMAWMTGLLLLVSPPDLLMMAAACAATPGATAKTAFATAWASAAVVPPILFCAARATVATAVASSSRVSVSVFARASVKKSLKRPVSR